MGDKIESMDGDLNSALGMLRKNHQVGGMISMTLSMTSFMILSVLLLLMMSKLLMTVLLPSIKMMTSLVQMLRGHDISTKQDKRDYDEMTETLLQHKLR